MTIGDRIKESRNTIGLTQKELGEQLGVAEITIRKYESGDLGVKMARLKEIASILNTSANYLMSGISDEDTQTLSENVKKIEIQERFLKSLGYKIEYVTDTEIDGDQINDLMAIYINDVRYSENQFEILIKSIKDLVNNSNNLLNECN